MSWNLDYFLVESVISDHFNDLDDNSVAATLTFAFKGEKPYVYKIIKNPKERKID